MKMARYLDTNVPDQKIKVSVDYALGGLNYFSGGVSARGVYAYVMNVKLETHTLPGGDRWTSESFSLFGGGNARTLLVPLNRRSQKALDATWGRVQKDVDGKTGLVWDMVMSCATKNNLTVN